MNSTSDEGKYQCYDSPLCNADVFPTKMQTMACPYESWPCGASSPYIELSMNETYELSIYNRLEGSGSCWYRFGVDDMIDESELEPQNLKHMQVYVNSLSSAYMYIAGATSEAAIGEDDVTIVSPELYHYNFTQANT